MKFPSLASLASAAQATLARFPFVLLAGLSSAVAIIYNIESDTRDERWMLVSGLGIALLFGIALFSERRGWSLPVRLAAQAGGVVVLLLYYLSLPFHLDIVDEIRLSLFVIAFHLFAAFAPFTVRDEVEGFWRYNEILFLRVLTAVLFTLVLYGGLSLALVSIDRLFNIEVGYRAYGKLAALLFGVFNTWFFLAGVPRDFSALGQGFSYPRGLKIFTQYVLLPLVSIYLVILYLYAGKIVVTWQWPNGWVSALVIGFAIAGILSALLLWPVREEEGNRWIRRFSGGFYWALLPLTVLLLLAIWRRISDYGLTEHRYFVIIIAFWLAGIAIYFIISRRDNIKVIPITLCILAIAGTFGPWSASSVAIRSQVVRLGDLLEREKIVVAGRIVPAREGDSLSKDAESRIYSILDFLDRRDALTDLSSVLPSLPLDTLGVAEIAGKLGLDSRFGYGQGAGSFADSNAGPFELQASTLLGGGSAFSVSGFAVAHHLEMSALTARPERFVVDGFAYAVSYDDVTGILTVATDSAGSATFDLPALADRAVASARTPADSMDGPPRSFDERLGALPPAALVVDGTGRLRSRLLFSRITVNKIEGKTRVSFFDGYLLLK